MEIKEKELVNDTRGSCAILMKASCMDPCAVNCSLNALDCESATSYIAQRTCVAVD